MSELVTIALGFGILSAAAKHFRPEPSWSAVVGKFAVFCLAVAVLQLALRQNMPVPCIVMSWVFVVLNAILVILHTLSAVAVWMIKQEGNQ